MIDIYTPSVIVVNVVNRTTSNEVHEVLKLSDEQRLGYAYDDRVQYALASQVP